MPNELTRPVTRRARPAPRPTTDILAELSQAVPLTEAPLSSPSGVPKPWWRTSGEPLEQRARKLTDVLETILSDRESGYRTDAALYQDFLVRSRMARISGSPMSLPEFRRRVAIARSGVDEETAAGEAWAAALKLADRVSEDLQGVFLMLARAAIKAEPCPSDARIAGAYGTHSARRARRLLGYFEEQGLIIVHADPFGKRIVGMPDLQAETAPGAADAPDEDAGMPRRQSKVLLKSRRECDWPATNR
jgi:hypothetical protein